MPEIVGHVDARNRPLVNISVPGQDDAVLAQIDTGFNGYLFLHEEVAKRLGFISTDVRITVEFADHTQHRAYLAGGRIAWFGGVLNVEAVVKILSPPRAAMPDEPIALIGKALLNPHKLIVDFATRRVVLAEGA